MSSRRHVRPSFAMLALAWLGALLSTMLLVPTGGAIAADASSFRSCSINSSGLSVNACGKQSFNPGDLLVLVLFAGSVIIVAALFTHAWRLSRRPA